MSNIPRLSDKEMLIMRILIDQPDSYGLGIIEASGGKLKLGTLYTTLSRMEDKGYVESTKEAQRDGARGLPRRFYRATGLGERVYAAWEVAGQQFAEGLV